MEDNTKSTYFLKSIADYPYPHVPLGKYNMPEKSDDSRMSLPSAEFEKIIAERDELKHQNSYLEQSIRIVNDLYKSAHRELMTTNNHHVALLSDYVNLLASKEVEEKKTQRMLDNIFYAIEMRDAPECSCEECQDGYDDDGYNPWEG